MSEREGNIHFEMTAKPLDEQHPTLKIISKYFNQSEALQFTLSDYHGTLGSCEGLLYNKGLFIPMPHLTDNTNKECFLSMIRHCENHHCADKIVACLDKAAPDKAKLIRTLMFMGFKGALPAKYPNVLPNEKTMLFMLYKLN